MSSIRTEPIALDTNEYVLGIRRSSQAPSCTTLLFDYIPRIRIFVPVRVIVEMHGELFQIEQDAVYDVIYSAAEVLWDFSRPDKDIISAYESRGAKTGDAVIAAHLQVAGVKWLISENRHS